MNTLIEKAQPDQSQEIHDFIRKVFDEHVAPEYSEEGNNEFYMYIEPDATSKRLVENHFILLAVLDGKKVGLIEVRDYNHISMLFVDSQYQRKGIGRSLMDEALKICKENNKDLKTVTVHSSPNSNSAYAKFGFVPTDEEKMTNWIRYTAMELKVN